MKIKTPALLPSLLPSLLLSSVVLLSGWNSCFASDTFTSAQKDQLISKLAGAIDRQYVLADEGAEFSRQLLAKQQNGAYADSTTKADFVGQLNKSLYAITHDKHVNVRPIDAQKPQGRMMKKVLQSGAGKTMVKQAPAQAKTKRQSLKSRFGLPPGPSIQTAVLAGNIGLLTVDDLMGSIAEIDTAMAQLNPTDGLIIDVRQCPGGSGDISRQLASYFMPEGAELMRYHTRGEPVTVGRSVKLPATASRYLNKPVYLVTSGHTGSACESLAYVLKYHDLAVVLGEKTAGAGHALTHELTPVGFGLAAFIPNSRPEHPKHQGGFEKVGVAVDIDVSAPIAVDRAQQLILSQLLAKNESQAELAAALTQSTNKINKQLLEQVNDRRKYTPLLSAYGEADALIFERGQLKLKTPGGRKFLLKQLGEDLFAIVSKRSDQKIRVERNAQGSVTGISMSPRKGQTQWKQLHRG